MKKLGKLSINPEKIINNEELVNLRGGGYGDACGPGFTERQCLVQACQGCDWQGPAYVCVGPGQNEETLLREHFPDMVAYACANEIQ